MKSIDPKATLRRSLVVMTVLLLLAPAALADKAARWKFSKGQKLVYVIKQKVNSSSEVAGRKFEQEQVQTLDVTWLVKDVDSAGNATISQTIDRMRMKMGGIVPGQEFEFDTKDEKEPEGPLAAMVPILKAFVANPIELTMSPRGQISKVVIPAKLTEAAQTMGAMAAMFSEEGMKNMTTQSSIILPEKPVEAGKEWTDSKKIEVPFGTMVMTMTYKFEGEGGTLPLETIGLATKVDIEPKANSPFGQVKITEQDSKGKAVFDTAAGVLKSSTMSVKMTMSITLNGMMIESKTDTVGGMELVKPDSKP